VIAPSLLRTWADRLDTVELIGNGGLYKKGGGFVAYPGRRIAAHGTQYNKSSTTLCTTWGAYRRIKASSIYAY